VTEAYADASALFKLVVRERETDALDTHLQADPYALASSALVRVELARAVRVRNPESASILGDLLTRLTLVPADDAVLALAARLADARLRTLDAVHLASALTLGAEEMLVYDRRLAEAAEAAGIRVLAPGR
jgi:predicted nucleic acid-binding protein